MKNIFFFTKGNNLRYSHLGNEVVLFLKRPGNTHVITVPSANGPQRPEKEKKCDIQVRKEVEL